MKTLSIIGIIWFSILFLGMSEFADYEPDAAMGCGFLAIIYAIPYSIVGLVKSIKSKPTFDSIEELKKLSELKDLGILTENEFIKRKGEILNHY